MAHSSSLHCSSWQSSLTQYKMQRSSVQGRSVQSNCFCSHCHCACVSFCTTGFSSWALPARQQGLQTATLRLYKASPSSRHSSLSRPHASSSLLVDTAAGADAFRFLETVEVALLVAAIAVSGLPLLSGEAKRRNARTYAQEMEEPDAEEDIMWGVMSVVSAIPFVNWTAWVFAAIASEDQRAARKYYAIALLYAWPTLLRGLDLDAFSIACLLAGILHVQIERVANTEPVAVELPGGEDISRAAGQASKALQDTTVAFSDAVREAREEQQTQQREQEQKKAQELEGSIDADLLEEWDARLQRKAAQQTKSGSQRNGSA